MIIMERTLKFRARIKKVGNNKSESKRWEYFYLWELEDGKKIRGSGEIIEFFEQYTGLKDKNSKEIYEGDILKFRGRAYGVKFDNYGQFYMENKNYHWLENGYSFRSVDIWCAEGILVEIIGNIHENQELLEHNG